MAEFIHLHLHTEYSLLDGACRVGELIEHASRQKIGALAVTELALDADGGEMPSNPAPGDPE